MRLLSHLIHLTVPALLLGLTLATPLDITASNVTLSPNSSNLNIPPEFKVRVSVDAAKPLDARAVWRSMFNAMYEVTGDDPSTPWWNTEWEPEGLGVIASLKVASAPVPAQYLIWAFDYVATSMGISSSSRNSELTAVLQWKGEEVGTISIRSSTPGRNALLGTVSQANTTKISRIDPLRSSLRALGSDEGLKITLSYGRNPIDENVIWQTAIKAVGQAAEAGLDTAANAIATYGINGCMWFLTAGYGPTMRYGYSREAVRLTIARFIFDDRFQEMYVFIHVDGRIVANGAMDSMKGHSVA